MLPKSNFSLKTFLEHPKINYSKPSNMSYNITEHNIFLFLPLFPRVAPNVEEESALIKVYTQYDKNIT